MKKIYHVTVHTEYYCVADSEFDAKDLQLDFDHEQEFDAREIRNLKEISPYWLDEFVSGEERDINWREWIKEREQEELEKKKQEELDALQLNLPLLG